GAHRSGPTVRTTGPAGVGRKSRSCQAFVLGASAAVSEGGEMKPYAFDYLAANSAQEAVDLLAELGNDARILAGGQSLMAVLNMRLAQPSALIDISRTADLDYVRIEKGHMAVGAAATQASVEWRADLADEVPLLAQAIPY